MLSDSEIDAIKMADEVGVLPRIMWEWLQRGRRPGYNSTTEFYRRMKLSREELIVLARKELTEEGIIKDMSKPLITELKLTAGEKELLLDYCFKIDLSIHNIVRKLILRELIDEKLLAEMSSKQKHVKVKEDGL